MLMRVQKGMWGRESKSLRIEFLNICCAARARTGTQSVPFIRDVKCGFIARTTLNLALPWTRVAPHYRASLQW